LVFEAYAHWLSSEMKPLSDALEQQIVRALRDLDDEDVAKKLRGICRHPRYTLGAREHLTRIVRRAIVDSPFDGVARVYADVISENERQMWWKSRSARGEFQQDADGILKIREGMVSEVETESGSEIEPETAAVQEELGRATG
jgi:hypothetical protein